MKLRDQGDMDRKLYERLLLEMRVAGVEEIGLFYLGESFLVKWLDEAIYFAKHVAKFPYVFLTSNMSLAKPRRVRECMVSGLDSLKWSLNYADEKQFVEITNVTPKLWQVCLSNLRDAKKIRNEVYEEFGHRCSLSASYIIYDGEQGERMDAMVADVSPYVDEIYSLPLYGQGGFVTEKEREAGWEVSPGNRGRFENLRPPIPCWAIFQEGHVTWDGKLSACCFDHNSNWEMGDLTKDSFTSAWNSDKFVALREAHISDNIGGTPCEKCLS